MQFLAFTDESTPLAQAIPHSHSTTLVVISLLIAMLAALASFSHVDLLRSNLSRANRLGWHLHGAVIMGIGVWTMHFTGMTAMNTPLDVYYHPGLTALSMLPAIAAAYVVLNITAHHQSRTPMLIASGVLMGAGIGAMHYTGMAAMVVEARVLHHPEGFVASVMVALILATSALFAHNLLRQRLASRLQLYFISAVIMAFAIAGMHYAGMHAAVLLPSDTESALAGGWVIDDGLMAAVVIIVAVMTVLTGLLTALLRHRILQANEEATRSQREARQLYNQLRKIATRLPGVVYQFKRSPDGHFSFPYASQAMQDMFGIDPDKVADNAAAVIDRTHPDDRERLMESIEYSATTLQPWSLEYRVQFDDGSERWHFGNALPEYEPDGSVLWHGFLTDITERKQTDELVNRLAFYDPLTDLPNRRLLMDRLEQMLATSQRHNTHGAVLFIDLNNFKRLNDTRGHSIGDLLLKEVANRLRTQVRAEDTVARLGGDEFVIVTGNLGESLEEAATHAEHIAHKFHDLMQRPFDLREQDYTCDISIGITLFHGDALSCEELLKRSDFAMYQAKSSRDSDVHFFDPKNQAALEARFQLERELREAIAGQQFLLHFQPLLNHHRHIIGCEALVRWEHPARGMVPPGDFIPIAEETGLIMALGRIVLDTACRQLALWQGGVDTDHLIMAVNVSAGQFHQPNFVEDVERILAETGARATHLKLELTESLVLEDMADTVRKMHALKQVGVQFSMDDFGTGYSSLAYLSNLPFDEVKIDKTFVQGCESDAHSLIIVESIISLARKLGMRIIAEGVETQSHLDILVERQCQFFQGFFFSKPVPLLEFEAQLRPAA